MGNGGVGNWHNAVKQLQAMIFFLSHFRVKGCFTICCNYYFT